MTLKNATLLALVGMILLTILLAAGFIVSVTGFLRGVVSVVAVLSSLIRVFGTLSLAVFFWVFHKEHA
jgi:hypothetical protein